MGEKAKSVGDLFQGQDGASAESVNHNSPLYDNKTSDQAGAAQKSARSKKSSAAFRTISEVADDLGLQQHVLRFWETKFSQVKPLKRGGGRRYYRPEDISLLKAIYHLLYVEGYTIKGVQKLLRDVGKRQIVASFSGDEPKDSELSRKSDVKLSDNTSPQNQETPAQGFNNKQREVLKSVLAELKDLRGMIKTRD